MIRNNFETINIINTLMYLIRTSSHVTKYGKHFIDTRLFINRNIYIYMYRIMRNTYRALHVLFYLLLLLFFFNLLAFHSNLLLYFIMLK